MARAESFQGSRLRGLPDQSRWTGGWTGHGDRPGGAEVVGQPRDGGGWPMEDETLPVHAPTIRHDTPQTS